MRSSSAAVAANPSASGLSTAPVGPRSMLVMAPSLLLEVHGRLLGRQALAGLLLGHQLLVVVVLADVVGIDELADVRALRRAVALRLLAPRALGERLAAVLFDRRDTDGVDAL